jgi:hypothetical protein
MESHGMLPDLNAKYNQLSSSLSDKNIKLLAFDSCHHSNQFFSRLLTPNVIGPSFTRIPDSWSETNVLSELIIQFRQEKR